MKKRLIATIILVLYIALLIKVMVLKDVPLIRVGSLMLDFGGTDASHPANFVPFRTILPYLLGYKGWIIAGINLIGNIILLVPIGILAPLVYRAMTWKKSLALAAISGLVIETLQVILHVGIFDIDDVILNAAGVMVGYGVFVVIARWARSRNYKNIIITVIVVITAAVTAFYGLAGLAQPHRTDGVQGTVSPGEEDPCGGTGGNGQIVSIGNNTVTIKRKDGKDQIMTFTDQVKVNTPAGSASVSDLKMGDRITMVGDANPDGTFSAYAVFVCRVSGTGQ